VRRARIFYLRNLTGKKARIKEKKRNFIADALNNNNEEGSNQSE
jgi:hypothetical protein